MPITPFPTLFAQAATAVQAAADALRYLKASSGDLQVYNLFNVWQAMQAANGITIALMTSAAADPTAAMAALPSFGGAPATVADLQAGFQNIQAAAQAFNVAAAAWIIANLSATDLLSIQPSTVNGVSSQVMTWTDHIPAGKIDVLRADPSLAALISAFEAIGATA
jgi:hypothetical protein